MLYDTILSCTPIVGGWSPDRKYRAESADGSRYFLRIAAPERAERMERVFRLQTQAAALALPIALPLECGPCPEGFYTIETWIEGEDARSAIPRRTEEQLYDDGLRAGRILRALHTIPAPADCPPWGPRFRAKLDQRLEDYRACPLKYEGDELLLRVVDEDRGLTAERPQCFRHGDYHAGNFRYRDGQLSVIDFDRCSFGDPWEEFKKILWTVEASPALARGVTDGYFDGRVPEEFWRLLRFYICYGQLGSLPWAIPFGEGEIRVMREQTRQVLRWYEHGIVPPFYG